MKKIISLVLVLSLVNFTFCQWSNLTSGTSQNLTSIQFVNDSTGYCSTDVGAILKTTNGDNNWNIAGSCAALKLQFVNVDTGFAYGNNDIFKSTDGGVNWISKLYSTMGFTGLHFPTTSTGYACTATVGLDSNYIYKTTNSGENWSIVSAIPYWDVDFIYSIYFIDVDTGFFTNDYGLLYRTINAGLNWTLVFTPVLGPGVIDIFFSTPSIGYALELSDYWAKTTDGGATWTETFITSVNQFYSIDCPSVNNCHIAGGSLSAGILMKTTNGGTNWAQTGFTPAIFYYDVDFLNDTTGYACGSNGSIIKYGAGPSSMQEYSDKNFDIHPNPADEFTTLSFDNSDNEDFKVFIYNNHGEIVKEINNINSGAIQIDLKTLDVGLYYIHLYSSHQKFMGRKLVKI